MVILERVIFRFNALVIYSKNCTHLFLPSVTTLMDHGHLLRSREVLGATSYKKFSNYDHVSNPATDL